MKLHKWTKKTACNFSFQGQAVSAEGLSTVQHMLQLPLSVVIRVEALIIKLRSGIQVAWEVIDVTSQAEDWVDIQ
jgi:hypothetical protein